MRKCTIMSIGGMPCSGKSTIIKILVDKYNFEVFSTGQMFRDEAKKHGMSVFDFNKFLRENPSINFDDVIDTNTVKIAKEKFDSKVIFDSRMAWHFIPESLKVYLTVEENEMKNRLLLSDRPDSEKNITVNDGNNNSLLSRFNEENLRYKKLYGVDKSDLSHYDFVLDTTNLTPEKVAEKVYERYKSFVSR